MIDRALAVRRRFSLTLERNLAVIFALLGILLTALIALHWVLVIEPTLRADAESRSRAFARAQTSGIETLLRADHRPEQLADEIRTELDAVLLLKDESTGAPFVRRIVLVLDEELVALPPDSRNLARGVDQCPDCFVTEVPLYDPDGHLLVGIATFWSGSPPFSRVRSSSTILSAACAASSCGSAAPCFWSSDSPGSAPAGSCAGSARANPTCAPSSRPLPSR